MDYNNPDPKILNFMRALGQRESSNNPNVSSPNSRKEGSIGRFQYMPETFKGQAQKYFGGKALDGRPLDINDDSHQKLVKYAEIADLKSQGYRPDEIAAIHNMGEPNFKKNNGYAKELGAKQDWRGVNKLGVKYDTIDHVRAVTEYYKQYEGASQPQPETPVQPTPEEIVTNERQSLIEQGQPVSVNPQKTEPTFGGQIVRDVLNPFARVAQTVIKGVSPNATGLSGNYLGEVKPLPGPLSEEVQSKGGFTKGILQPVGVGTEIASNIIGGGAGKNILQQGFKQTLKKGAIRGLAEGSIGGGTQQLGSSLQNNESLENTLKNTGKGILLGGATGLGIGAGSSILGSGARVTKRGIQSVTPDSESIMNKVARLNPLDAKKFKDQFGVSHGEYLTKTGNFSTPENIIENEAKKFVNSIKEVDSALEKLPGVYQAEPLQTALDDLLARETRISTPGALSKDLKRIEILKNKHETEGLTMSEINEVKRIFERNIKLDFNKFINPEGVARANNIDNAIRKWQFNKAKQLGFTNLDEINKQTQASKFIVDKLGKKLIGQSGNNAVNLTDWIVLSGGDPTAVGGFLTKKLISSKSLQAKLAKMLSKGEKTPFIKANINSTTQTKPKPQPLLKK